MSILTKMRNESLYRWKQKYGDATRPDDRFLPGRTQHDRTALATTDGWRPGGIRLSVTGRRL